jgi:hypothetical protein
LCGPETIRFDYRFGFLPPLAGTTVPVVLSLDGTGPPDYSFKEFAGTIPTSESNLIFEQTITSDRGGAFGGTFLLGEFTFGDFTNQQINEAELFLAIPSLGDTQPIVIRNMTLRFGSTDSVPEPATLFLVAAGIGAFGLRRRRHR